MSHGLKLLLIAAGAIITCIVVVVGFQLTKSGKNDTNKASEQFSSVTADYDDVKLASYDDLTISGSDVATCIMDCKSLLASTEYDFTIHINTIANNTGIDYTRSTYEAYYATNTAIANSTEDNYINPTAQFKGSVSRNANGIINKITFTQQK